MIVFPLHGTLGWHDGVGVLVVVSTLAAWTALSALGARQGLAGARTPTRRRRTPATEDARAGHRSCGGATPDVAPGGAVRALNGDTGAGVASRGQTGFGLPERETAS